MNKFITLFLTLIIGCSFGQEYHLKQVIGDSDASLQISSFRKPFVANESTIAYLNRIDQTVQVFSKTGEEWEYAQTLSNVNLSSNTSFGEFITIDSNELVISDRATGDDEGTIYYYEKQPANDLWEIYDSLPYPFVVSSSSSPYWGAGMVINSGQMPVGRTNGLSSSVQVLAKDSANNWGLTETLSAPSFVSANYAISHNELIVAGHYFFDIDRLFSFSKNQDGTWNSDYATINIPDVAGVRRLGNDMVIYGDYLLAGSPEDDFMTDTDTVEAAGSAFLFKKVEGSWVFEQRFFAETPTRNFGASVAMQDNQLLISNHGDSSAVLYALAEGVWEKSQLFKAEGLDLEESNFGRYVDFSGDQIVVSSEEIVHIYATDSKDCNLEEDGTAFIDLCGYCSGGTTGVTIQTNTNTCEVVGLSDTEERLVSVFPNPAQSFLTVNAKQNDRVIIYSLLGDQVLDQVMVSDHVKLSLEELTQGTYLIKVTGQEGTFTDTFVVK